MNLTLKNEYDFEKSVYNAYNNCVHTPIDKTQD